MNWRAVPGYEGLYLVSDAGEIRSIGHRVSPRFMKLHTRKRDGYVAVTLARDKARKVVRVHRVVAEAFLAERRGDQVDHINGDRADNRVVNLRWVSASVNGSNRTRPWAASQMVGVYKSSSKSNPYRSAVCVEGVKRSLGVFKTAGEAQAARLQALKEVGRG